MDYSVLMSVYAKEKPEYLRMSIESMLQQTCPTNDFVLVCDGKLTEELYAVIDFFCEKNPELFQIIQLEKNGGLSNALNIGLQKCKNEIVARMDSDDVSYPYRCQMQLKVMQEQAYDIVGGNVDEFVDTPDIIQSKRIVPHTHKEIVQYSKRRNPFNHPAVMYRKSKVLAGGGYKEFPLFEDYYLWIKMIQNGSRTYNIQTSLVCMRVGAGLYTRRGGFRYVKKIVRFRYALLRERYINIGDFLIAVIGHSAVSLVPNGVRRFVYQRILRK